MIHRWLGGGCRYCFISFSIYTDVVMKNKPLGGGVLFDDVTIALNLVN